MTVGNRIQQGSDVTQNRDNGDGLQYEIIDSIELAKRWALPASWVRQHTRARAVDPIPHVRFGKYVRFRWGSTELVRWLEKRMSK